MLGWLVAGCEAWQTQGLDEPSQVVEATAADPSAAAKYDTGVVPEAIGC